MSERVITPPRSGRGDIAYSSSTLPLRAQDEAGFHWSTRTGFLQNGDEPFAHFPLIATLSNRLISFTFFIYHRDHYTACNGFGNSQLKY